MCVINVSNKRKTDKWRKICLFPAGFEPATLCMWGTRDNRYTIETCYVCRLLFGFHITGWLPKKWKKWFEHAAFWSGVRRATVAPRSQVVWGPIEIWIRIAGFKVQSANHYTIEPDPDPALMTDFYLISTFSHLYLWEWLYDSTDLVIGRMPTG